VKDDKVTKKAANALGQLKSKPDPEPCSGTGFRQATGTGNHTEDIPHPVYTCCPDCGAGVGELHGENCDAERCPRCGMQAISCNCIYEIHGIKVATMEQTHPRLYHNGPSRAMLLNWEKFWGPKRMPWKGEWHGLSDCRELGLYSKPIPGGNSYIPCESHEEGAFESLNRLALEAEWCREHQKFVKKGEAKCHTSI
jgi:hypothetical protein